MLAVARRFHTPWLLVLAVCAFVAAVWLARPEMPTAVSDTGAHADALAIASRAHTSFTTVATRALAPCARSEHPPRQPHRLDTGATGPDDDVHSLRTPLYALLRVFLL